MRNKAEISVRRNSCVGSESLFQVKFLFLSKNEMILKFWNFFLFFFSISDPETIGPGKIMVQVTLPKYGDQSFSSISRSPKMAKWGAAKSALLQFKKQFNEYVPYKTSELAK